MSNFGLGKNLYYESLLNIDSKDRFDYYNNNSFERRKNAKVKWDFFDKFQLNEDVEQYIW